MSSCQENNDRHREFAPASHVWGRVLYFTCSKSYGKSFFSTKNLYIKFSLVIKLSTCKKTTTFYMYLDSAAWTKLNQRGRLVASLCNGVTAPMANNNWNLVATEVMSVRSKLTKLSPVPLTYLIFTDYRLKYDRITRTTTISISAMPLLTKIENPEIPRKVGR